MKEKVKLAKEILAECQRLRESRCGECAHIRYDARDIMEFIEEIVRNVIDEAEKTDE